MPQKAIELILTRQLASYLAMPIFLVDAAGTLVFYNMYYSPRRHDGASDHPPR